MGSDEENETFRKFIQTEKMNDIKQEYEIYILYSFQFDGKVSPLRCALAHFEPIWEDRVITFEDYDAFKQ